MIQIEDSQIIRRLGSQIEDKYFLCTCNKNICLDGVKQEVAFYKLFLNDLKKRKREEKQKRRKKPLPELKFSSEGRQMFTRWKSSAKPITMLSKTFSIKYEKPLSTLERIFLNNFQKKYLFHAFDDIFDSLKSKPLEQTNLLSILYATAISSQNNFLIDFFDIWIDEVYIHPLLKKTNKFLNGSSLSSKSCTYITIKLVFNKKVLPKKPDILW